MKQEIVIKWDLGGPDAVFVTSRRDIAKALEAARGMMVEREPEGHRGSTSVFDVSKALGQLSPNSGDVAQPAQPARVYVASALPNIVAAAVLASQLTDVGVEVVSTWHAVGGTVEAEKRMPYEERARLAIRCFDEIDRADVFVWLHGESGDRVGAAVEYGYALKGAKIIYLVPLGERAAPSVFGALGPEITITALLRRLGGA